MFVLDVRKFVCFSVVGLFPFFALGQQESEKEKTIVLDSGKLPFFIHPSKRMSDEELADKKEGLFLTGLPRIQFDPIRGFGFGGEASLFLNGKRDDPFFAWTPYRHKVSLEAFGVMNGSYRFGLNYDVPYMFNKKWRMRANMYVQNDPNAQYWGVGRQTLGAMSFADKSGGGYGVSRSFNRFDDYEENLGTGVRENGRWVSDLLYHDMHHREQLYNVLIERVELGGRLRLMMGYEALFTRFTDYSGKKINEPVADMEGNEIQDEVVNRSSAVREDQARGTWNRLNLTGFDDRWNHTSILGLAVIYDTRDFEPDPSKGVFAEYSYEMSLPLFGSPFRQFKHMALIEGFYTPLHWRKNRSRLTLAGNLALGQVFGSRINFIELFDLSSQAEAGGTPVLGGYRSLRGYRENRFMAPIILLCNLEARTRIYDFNFLKQHWAVGLNIFYDFGTAAETFGQVFEFDGLRGSYGIGGRLAWNQSTIIRGDWGISKESSQFFLGIGHIF
jgi:hypothetical protein